MHIRIIDDKWLKVTETKHGEDDIPEREVEPEMTEDQMKEFEEEWSRLWSPTLHTMEDIQQQLQ